MGRTISYRRLPNFSVFSYVLPDRPFFQTTSDYLILCFTRLYSGETTAGLVALKVLHLLELALYFIFSRQPNLSFKHSLVLFTFSLVLSSLQKSYPHA